MKRTLTILILMVSLFCYKNTIAQVIEKQQCLGGSDTEKISIETRLYDSSFIIINTSKSSDLDVGINYGRNDIWLLKYDKNYNLLWKKVIGTSKNDIPIGSTTDSAYNLYLNYNSYDLNNTSFDNNLAKIDAQGNLIWTKNIDSYSLRYSISRIRYYNNSLYLYYTSKADTGILYKIDAATGNNVFKKYHTPIDTVYKFPNYFTTGSSENSYLNILTDNTILIGKSGLKMNGSAYNYTYYIYKIDLSTGAVLNSKRFLYHVANLRNIGNNKTFYAYVNTNSDLTYGILDKDLNIIGRDSILYTSGYQLSFDTYSSLNVISNNNNIYFIYSKSDDFLSNYSNIYLRKIGFDASYKSEVLLGSISFITYPNGINYAEIISIDSSKRINILYSDFTDVFSTIRKTVDVLSIYDTSLSLIKKIPLRNNIKINDRAYILSTFQNTGNDPGNFILQFKGVDSANASSIIYGLLKYKQNGMLLDSNYIILTDLQGTDFFNIINTYKNLDFYIAGHTDNLCETNNYQINLLKIKKVLSDYNLISGKAYIDNNNNNTYDTGIDYLFSQGYAKSSKSAINTSSFADDSGRYSNIVDTGTYNTIFTGYNNYYTINPVSKTTTHPTYGNVDSIDFALHPKGNIKDLRITLINTWVTRPGFTNSYDAIYTNEGTTVVNNASVSVVLDNRLTYNNAVPSPSSVEGDTLKWNLAAINPSRQGKITINFIGKIPPILNGNDSLITYATIYPVVNDTTPIDNQYTLTDVAKNAFDPNDKNIESNAVLSTAQISSGDYITYRIRFQNTGNYVATNVIITDTLEGNLDWSSLQIIESSHTGLQTSVTGNNIVTFKFNNINLPSSSVNYAASHGYVVFKIKPKNTLVPGNTIKNTAHIVFDFNAPVGTNTAVAKVITVTATINKYNTIGELNLLPNPNNGNFTLDFSSKGNYPITITLFDMTGKVIYQQYLQHNNRSLIQISDATLASGLYNVQISSNKDIWNKKVMIVK